MINLSFDYKIVKSYVPTKLHYRYEIIFEYKGKRLSCALIDDLVHPSGDVNIIRRLIDLVDEYIKEQESPEPINAN